mgnify:FL=1
MQAPSNSYLKYIKNKYEDQKTIVEQLEADRASDQIVSQAKKEKLSLRDHLEYLEKYFSK